MKYFLMIIICLISLISYSQSKILDKFFENVITVNEISNDSINYFYHVTNKEFSDLKEIPLEYYSFDKGDERLNGYWLFEDSIVYFSPEIFGIEKCITLYPVIDLIKFEEGKIYVLRERENLNKQCVNSTIFFDFYFVKVNKIINCLNNDIYVLTFYQNINLVDYEDINEFEMQESYLFYTESKKEFSTVDMVFSIKDGILSLENYKCKKGFKLLPFSTR